MEAKDTVMNATTKRQFRIITTKPRIDYWDIDNALELQAEITWNIAKQVGFEIGLQQGLAEGYRKGVRDGKRKLK